MPRAFPDNFPGFAQNGQVGQPEEVHLEQTDAGDIVHGELGHDTALTVRPCALAAAGHVLVSGSLEITTPAAWVLAWREMPSTFRAESIRLRMMGLHGKSLQFGILFHARPRVILGRKGHQPGHTVDIAVSHPSARPTSRIAARAPSVPKVIIWATWSCPYFWET